MIWMRRALLEMWAMAVIAAVTGFLGPFGTYSDGDFLSRLLRWGLMLMGAYVVIRPVALLCRWLAHVTHLPRGMLVLWGTIVASFPMAFTWFESAPRETRALGGFTGLLPFAMLCACLVLVVAWWAERADAHLRLYYVEGLPGFAGGGAEEGDGSPPPAPSPGAKIGRQRLRDRLSRGFVGDILALESEDHYVRVHGNRQSELLLIRLRDAIAEMDGTPGEQTHRSWWVARGAVTDIITAGRNRQIRLTNGLLVPVARESIHRLTKAGFLPG